MEEPHVSARSADLDGPRLTLAMVLEHGDHVVDIFDSGEALALALPDLLGVAAALGDCNSWISMATTTSTGSSSRFFTTWREGHSRSWGPEGSRGALLKSFTSSMATATGLRVRGRLRMLLPVQSRQCEASTAVRASRNTRWRGRIYFRPVVEGHSRGTCEVGSSPKCQAGRGDSNGQVDPDPDRRIPRLPNIKAMKHRLTFERDRSHHIVADTAHHRFSNMGDKITQLILSFILSSCEMVQPSYHPVPRTSLTPSRAMIPNIAT